MFCDSTNKVCFGDFAKGLNPFHASATLDEKIGYVFYVFDMD